MEKKCTELPVYWIVKLSTYKIGSKFTSNQVLNPSYLKDIRAKQMYLFIPVSYESGFSLMPHSRPANKPLWMEDSTMCLLCIALLIESQHELESMHKHCNYV